MTHNIPGSVKKVKFLESFKDGTMFEGRNFKAGDEWTMTPEEVEAARRSGAVLEINDTLMPNPLKKKEEQPEDSEVTKKRGKG